MGVWGPVKRLESNLTTLGLYPIIYFEGGVLYCNDKLYLTIRCLLSKCETLLKKNYTMFIIHLIYPVWIIFSGYLHQNRKLSYAK